MAQQPRDCDVLMAPHHGSLRSAPREFSAWCTPEWVVISRGTKSGHGPTPQSPFSQLGYHVFDTANHIASLGYWLSADKQGEGIVTEAANALTRHAFEVLDANRVEIRAAEFNHKSRAIPERLGFTQEGILRDKENLYGNYVDHVMYSMLHSEFERPADES